MTNFPENFNAVSILMQQTCDTFQVLGVFLFYICVLIVSIMFILFSILNVQSLICALNKLVGSVIGWWKVKYIGAHLRYKSKLSWFMSAHHRVALACARLTVREHTNIVALERVFQHLQPNVLIDTSLTREICVTRLITNRTN